MSHETSQAPPDGLVTRGEVATRLRVTKHTVRNMVKRGELTEIRLSSKLIRYAKSEVDALLAAVSTPSTSN